MNSFWQGLGRGARTGLVVGAAVILLATGFMAWWAFKANYQVLFADLKPQDASVMTDELDKLKIPYRIGDGGTTLLVEEANVHATRIKLMGKELPLHGAVGFEVFNNTDFGMTEFAQKINYQRALQGELTRTILSLSEIRDARVHLALPEQGLFKQASSKPKAAITLTLREGQALRAEQINGIQRLVAAATPGMQAQDVTVVDKQGVALSRLSDEAPDAQGAQMGTGGNARLELKKETETQLARKATAVLDKAFGAGQALVTVDVTLNMDQVRTTTEDIIPAPSRQGDSRGVIVKERESVRETGVAPLDSARNPGGGGSTQREVDYQVGRRVEQVVSMAGSIRRIHVVAVVRQSLQPAQEDQLRRLLAAAVGATGERGDTVVVQSLQSWLPAPAGGPASPGAAGNTEALGLAASPTLQSSTAIGQPAAHDRDALLVRFAIGLAAVAVLAVAFVAFAGQRRAARPAGRAQALNPDEKQAALARVQAWMQDRAPGTERGT